MIRLAKKEEMERLLEIYASAREFMRKNGNPTQWNNNYPNKKILFDDMNKNALFVIESSDDKNICGCFALIGGEDPTYEVLEGGEWKSDSPYGTIHRVAGDGTEKGIFNKCVQFARESYKHLRVDTHEDNLPMQKVILKNGFEYRGTIYLSDGSPRKAYEWIDEN